MVPDGKRGSRATQSGGDYRTVDRTLASLASSAVIRHHRWEEGQPEELLPPSLDVDRVSYPPIHFCRLGTGAQVLGFLEIPSPHP
jgi:hypothetical protein